MSAGVSDDYGRAHATTLNNTFQEGGRFLPFSVVNVFSFKEALFCFFLVFPYAMT